MGAGMCKSSAEGLEFDRNWTPEDLGDFILDCDEDKILRIFDNRATRPRKELMAVLQNSLFYYLVHKNHRDEYPKKKEYAIQRAMDDQGFKTDAKLKEQLEPLCKWMMENKLPRSQATIEADNYAETVGKWFDEYRENMNAL